MRASEYIFTPEQDALRESISGFLAATTGDPEEARRAAGTPEADRLWERIGGELELTGLGTPEALGGSGTWLEACIALEEMGYASYAGPYLSTVGLAQSLLLATPADGGARDELVRAVASGARTASVALSPGYGGGVAALDAQRSGDGWTLSGGSGPVLDGASASFVLAVLPVDDGLGVFAFDPRGSGVELTDEDPLDIMRAVATMSLVDAPATLVAAAVSPDALAVAQARSQAALACEAAGGMQACLEAAVEYAQQRRQFGRAIGSFQALKHMLADVLVIVESARALAYEAAETVSGADEGIDWLVVSAAKAFCSDSYLQVAGEAIQVHGAIGFTWEQGVHRFYRRAVATKGLLGSPHDHRGRIARLLLEDDAAPAGAGGRSW